MAKSYRTEYKANPAILRLDTEADVVEAIKVARERMSHYPEEHIERTEKIPEYIKRLEGKLIKNKIDKMGSK